MLWTRPSGPDANGHRYVLSSATCSDSDSGFDAGTGSIIYRVESGESVSCDATFSLRDVYQTTVVTGFCLPTTTIPPCIPGVSPYLSQQISIFWWSQDGAVTVNGSSVLGDTANLDPVSLIAAYFGVDFSYDPTAEHVNVSGGTVQVAGEWNQETDIVSLLSSVIPGGKLFDKFIKKAFSSKVVEKEFIAWSVACWRSNSRGSSIL